MKFTTRHAALACACAFTLAGCTMPAQQAAKSRPSSASPATGTARAPAGPAPTPVKKVSPAELCREEITFFTNYIADPSIRAQYTAKQVTVRDAKRKTKPQKISAEEFLSTFNLVQRGPEVYLRNAQGQVGKQEVELTWRPLKGGGDAVIYVADPKLMFENPDGERDERFLPRYIIKPSGKCFAVVEHVR